jgi:sulfur dioxygenase
MGPAVKKDLSQILQHPTEHGPEWALTVWVNDDNLTYLAMNTKSHEAIWVDPVYEDFEQYAKECSKLNQCRFIGVIDTHTHADHLSCATKLATHLKTPLIMHHHAPATGVSLRVSTDTSLSTASGPLKLLLTPGHTWDGITLIWGPYIFTGDTILYGDVGRDDLPTGNPKEHYDSLVKIKSIAEPNQIFLPGHDLKGGRASSWAHQLLNNTSLTQSELDFIREATEFSAPAPRLLKESLFFNFK